MIKSSRTAALAAALAIALAGCGASFHPATTVVTASPCTALAAWKNGPGGTALARVGRALGALGTDAINGGALDGDGQRLYAAATAAQATPPPVGRAQYLKALRLAARAAVFAQSGDYQDAATAITETGDLFDVMTSTVKGKCG